MAETLTPQGPFSLAEAARFLADFTPAGHPGPAAGHLHLAFPSRPEGEAVAACVRQPDTDVVIEVVAGSDHDGAVADVTRMLSLDVDARDFEDVGERDPVIAGLLADRPGFRPVGFASPWEAAVWAVLSQRTRMTQAAAVRRRIAERHGTTVEVHGQQLRVFSGPATLADIVDDMPVSEVKQRRLAAVTEAALDGHLDADRLRAMPVEDALAALQEIDGIGPFSADLVLLRGAMLVDVLPTRERRLLAGVGSLYDIADAGADDLSRVAEAWAPYRTWCSVLVRSALERS